MLRTNIIYLFSVVTICCSYNFVSAQPPDDQIVISPQIHPDKTVTFRYMAPSARNVMLSGQFEKQASAMKKDSSGTWSVTIGPVKPDIYPYYFIADGIQVMDPANVDYFPNERFKASLVDIPGDSALIHSKKNVPHGTVTYEYYPSFGFITGSLVAYTPPDYEKNTTSLYPVLYLLPGTSDTEETWFKVGKVNLILDNLIAENKARSMIIVMPNGNVEATIAEQTGRPKPADPADRGSTEAIQRSISFQNDLINNIIPYIEKNYRVVSNRYGRAIGGFSREEARPSGQASAIWICSAGSAATVLILLIKKWKALTVIYGRIPAGQMNYLIYFGSVLVTRIPFTARPGNLWIFLQRKI